MHAAEHAHITPRIRYPTPSSTNRIELLQPRLLPSQSSYRIVREHPALTGSCSELFNAFTRPSSVSSAPTISSANATTSPARDRSAAAHPSMNTSRVSSDFSSDPTPSGSKINLRRVYCTFSRSTIYGSACLQRHATGLSAARILSR